MMHCRFKQRFFQESLFRNQKLIKCADGQEVSHDKYESFLFFLVLCVIIENEN